MANHDQMDRDMAVAMHSLECLAEFWAQATAIDEVVDAIYGDREKVRAMIINAYMEGCSRGRSSTVYAPIGKKERGDG